MAYTYLKIFIKRPLPVITKLPPSHPFSHPNLIHSRNIPDEACVPSTTLRAEDIAVNKTDKIPMIKTL